MQSQYFWEMCARAFVLRFTNHTLIATTAIIKTFYDSMSFFFIKKGKHTPQKTGGQIYFLI